LGRTDSQPYRLLNRARPAPALLIVSFSLLAILAFGMLSSPYFHDVMAFCTTVVGAVIGFYFSSRRDG
jgi:hypothetical protein